MSVPDPQIDVRAREQAEAIGNHCAMLLTQIGEAMEGGDTDEAQRLAQDLGSIVGKLGERSYLLQYTLEAVVFDPAIREAVSEVVAKTKLPTEA